MERRRFLRLGATFVLVSAAKGAARHAVDHLPSVDAPRDLTSEDFRRERRFAKMSQGRIAYVEIGRGPAALFLHGFPLNSFQWRGVIPRISAHRRCIAPDFLALGYTEVAEGQSVAASAQVAMVLQLLDRLSIPSVDIIANDSGGAVAQLLVAEHPKRVHSLLLTNCDTEPDSPPPAVLPVIELARAGRFAHEWLAPWLADKKLARSEKGLGGMCYMDASHPTDEAIETYLGPLVSSRSREALTNAYAMALSPNPLAGIEARLQRCHVPTRIVWGMADNIFSQASPDYFSRTLANCRGVRRITGAKLFFPEEMPELIAEEALDLWRTRT